MRVESTATPLLTNDEVEKVQLVLSVMYSN